VAHEPETDPARLRQLAERARRLADGTQDGLTQDRLRAAASEYEQRAKEIEMDDGTGQ
jgi:CRISPR/Cas system-associated protein Csm6